jgi:hypothetical protein
MPGLVQRLLWGVHGDGELYASFHGAATNEKPAQKLTAELSNLGAFSLKIIWRCLAAQRFLRRRFAFAVALRCQGANTALAPRPDIRESVERCKTASFSIAMRSYSAGAQVFLAIISFWRSSAFGAIVSHDASTSSVMITAMPGGGGRDDSGSPILLLGHIERFEPR